MELSKIQKILTQEFKCSWQRATDDIPVDRILVDLIGEDMDFELAIGYVQDHDNQLEKIRLLQFLTIIPCEIKTPQAQQKIHQLIMKINSQIPLMGFVYDYSSKNVFLRHITMLSKQQDHHEEIITETVWLLLYLLEMFYPTINAIALGKNVE